MKMYKIQNYSLREWAEVCALLVFNIYSWKQFGQHALSGATNPTLLPPCCYLWATGLLGYVSKYGHDESAHCARTSPSIESLHLFIYVIFLGKPKQKVMGKAVKTPSLTWMESLPPPPPIEELKQCEQDDELPENMDLGWVSVLPPQMHISLN